MLSLMRSKIAPSVARLYMYKSKYFIKVHLNRIFGLLDGQDYVQHQEIRTQEPTSCLPSRRRMLDSC